MQSPANGIPSPGQRQTQKCFSLSLRIPGGEQRLVCASRCIHSSSNSSQLSATIPQSWTEHATRQTHRRPQTTSHDVLSPQVGTQISNGSKERISGQVCGTLAVWCWKTRRSKHDGQNHPIPRGKAAFQNVSRRAMLYSIAQTDADLAAVFSKWYTGTTEHRMHCESAYTKNQCQQWSGSGLSFISMWFSLLLLTMYSGPLWETSAGYTIQVPSSLLTWTTGTCGSNRSTYCRQSLLSQ